MFNPWYGYPPPMWGQNPNSSPTLQDVVAGMSFFEDLKQKLEKEEKEKKEKSKKKPELPKFSFGELWGSVMLFSIPVTLGQLWLLQYVQQVLNATFTGHP